MIEIIDLNQFKPRWTTAGTEGTGEVLLRPHLRRRPMPDGGETGKSTGSCR